MGNILDRLPAPEIPSSLRESHYADIARRMSWSSPFYETDTSFAGELVRLKNRGIEGFLFTAYSAIPLADAVRAFYEKLGMPIPWLGYINASHIGRKGVEEKEYLKHEEARRLRPLLTDLGSVCIVEQLVNTHNTLLFAHSCVRDATDGAISQTDIRGKYYHGAQHADIDLESLSSTHWEFMREIGEEAAQAALSGNQ